MTEGKDLKAELMKTSSFEKLQDTIRKEDFLEFLKSRKIEISDFSADRIDTIFLMSNRIYNIKELLGYHKDHASGIVDSIAGDTFQGVRSVLEELIQYVISSKKPFIKSILDMDKGFNGLIDEDKFLEGAENAGIKTLRRDKEARDYIRFRYDRNGRINIFSMIFDMYMIRKHSQARIGDFIDFQNRRPDPKNAVLTKFTGLMEKNGITAEMLASDLIDMSQSRRIKVSLLLLKIREIMEFDETMNLNQSNSRLTGEDAPKHPLMSIFEIVEFVDDQYRGNFMDYQIVTLLKSYLDFGVRQFMDDLIKKMDHLNNDFRGFITDCLTAKDLVSIPKLKGFLLKMNFSEDSIYHAMKKLNLDGVSTYPLSNLQSKLEKEMILMKICESPSIIRKYIYGVSLDPQKDTKSMGVDDIITQINKGLGIRDRTFNEQFGFPGVKIMSNQDFLNVLRSLEVKYDKEFVSLTTECKSETPGFLSLSKLKEIYDSKYGMGSNREDSAVRKESLLRLIKERIKNLGFSPLTLFTRADNNDTKDLDRRVGQS